MGAESSLDSQALSPNDEESPSSKPPSITVISLP